MLFQQLAASLRARAQSIYVAHAARDYTSIASVNVSAAALMVGFQVSIRFCVSTKGLSDDIAAVSFAAFLRRETKLSA